MELVGWFPLWLMVGAVAVTGVQLVYDEDLNRKLVASALVRSDLVDLEIYL